MATQPPYKLTSPSTLTTEGALPVRRVVSRSLSGDAAPTLAGGENPATFSLPRRNTPISGGVVPVKPTGTPPKVDVSSSGKPRILISTQQRPRVVAGEGIAHRVHGSASVETSTLAAQHMSSRPSISLLTPASSPATDEPPASPPSPGLVVMKKEAFLSPSSSEATKARRSSIDNIINVSLPPPRYGGAPPAPNNGKPGLAIGGDEDDGDAGIKVIARPTLQPAKPEQRQHSNVSRTSYDDDLKYDDEDGYLPLELDGPRGDRKLRESCDLDASGSLSETFMEKVRQKAVEEAAAMLMRAGITPTSTSSAHSALNVNVNLYARQQPRDRAGLSLDVAEEARPGSSSLKDRRNVDRGCLLLDVDDQKPALAIKKVSSAPKPATDSAGAQGSARNAWYDDETPSDKGVSLDVVDELEIEGEDLGELSSVDEDDDDALNTTNSLTFQEGPGGTICIGKDLAIGHDGLKYAPLSIPRSGNIKSELIMLDEIGRGASASVQRAVHLPTLQLVAVKHIKIYDKTKQQEIARELKTLYANMVPLVRRRVMAYAGATPGAGTVAFPSGTLSSGALDTATTKAAGLFGILGLPMRTHFISDKSKLNESGGLDSSLDRSMDFNATFASQTLLDSNAFEGTLGPGDTLSGTLAATGEFYETDANPYLLKFYDAFVNKGAGTVSIVCEYMGGGSLQDVVDNGGCPDEAVLARMSAHVLRGLHFLHRNHQLHRDIKPANILMTTGGDKFKVADFGIAKQLDSTVAHARTWVGTMVYMSPERLQTDDDGYSYPSDIWSFGLTLLAVAAGRFPYENKNYWDLIKCMKDDPPPLHVLHAPPDSSNRNLRNAAFPSTDFIDFLEQCLRKDPSTRPTAEELLHHPFIMTHALDERARDRKHPLKVSEAMSGESAAALFAIESIDPFTVEVGIPMSKSPFVNRRFSGQLSDRSKHDQDRILRVIKDAISKLTGTYWPSFVRYFRRYKNKRRRKWYFSLDQTSFNGFLAEKLKETVGANLQLELPHFARSVSTGDGDAQPSAHPEFSIPSRSASTGVPASHGNLGDSHRVPVVSYKELRLDAADLAVMAKQLGMQMMWLLPAFNEAIKGKTHDSEVVPSAGGRAIEAEPKTNLSFSRQHSIRRKQNAAKAQLESTGSVALSEIAARATQGDEDAGLEHLASLQPSPEAALQPAAGNRRVVAVRLPASGSNTAYSSPPREEPRSLHGSRMTPDFGGIRSISGSYADNRLLEPRGPSPQERTPVRIDTGSRAGYSRMAVEVPSSAEDEAYKVRASSAGSRPPSNSSMRLAPLSHAPTPAPLSSFASPVSTKSQSRLSTPTQSTRLPPIDHGDAVSRTPAKTPRAVRGEVASVHLRDGSHSVVIPEMPSSRTPAARSVASGYPHAPEPDYNMVKHFGKPGLVSPASGVLSPPIKSSTSNLSGPSSSARTPSAASHGTHETLSPGLHQAVLSPPSRPPVSHLPRR